MFLSIVEVPREMNVIHAASARAFAMIVLRVQAEQSFPPYGRSGLRELFASARTCVLVPRATPKRRVPQSAHWGAAFLRRLYRMRTSPLGTLLKMRRNVRER